MADDVRLLDPDKEVITIRNSPLTLVLVLLVAVGITSTGAWMAWAAISGQATGEDVPAPLAYLSGTIVAASVLVFGLVTVTWARRFVTMTSPVMVISPNGFWDYRLRGAPIPWSKITRIEARVLGQTRLAFLSVDIETARRLDLIWEVRPLTRLNELFGQHGIYISTVATNIRLQSLIPVLNAYWNAHHAKESVNV